MDGPHSDHLRGHAVYQGAIQGGGADGGYGEIEAEVLFGFIASRKPRRVMQIGCGVSTAVC